jgi:hypothetical protein
VSPLGFARFNPKVQVRKSSLSKKMHSWRRTGSDLDGADCRHKAAIRSPFISRRIAALALRGVRIPRDAARPVREAVRLVPE